MLCVMANDAEDVLKSFVVFRTENSAAAFSFVQDHGRMGSVFFVYSVLSRAGAQAVCICVAFLQEEFGKNALRHCKHGRLNHNKHFQLKCWHQASFEV